MDEQRRIPDNLGKNRNWMNPGSCAGICSIDLFDSLQLIGQPVDISRAQTQGDEAKPAVENERMMMFIVLLSITSVQPPLQNAPGKIGFKLNGNP